MTVYKYICEYRNNGKLYTVYGCTLYPSYNECDRAASDRCSDLVEQGFTEVQADIVEFEKES